MRRSIQEIEELTLIETTAGKEKMQRDRKIKANRANARASTVRKRLAAAPGQQETHFATG